MRSLSLDGLLAGDDQQVQRIVAQDGGVEEAELILNGLAACPRNNVLNYNRLLQS